MATQILKYFVDANGQQWQLAINPNGTAQSMLVPTPASYTGPKSQIVLDDSTGAQWSVTTNTSGQLQTAASPGNSPVSSIIFQDSNEDYWQLSVNPNGTLTTTQVTNFNPLTTTQAGDIVSACVSDAQFATTNRLKLLAYVDRVHQRVLRESKWTFLSSLPQRFITQPGSTDYWIGQGPAPAGCVQTNLQLTDVWTIDEEAVFDRSNYRQLMRNSPSVMTGVELSFPDAGSRKGRPLSYYYEIGRPGIITINPIADNQNTYQPVPLSPVVNLVSNGSAPNYARTYYVYATFVDLAGNESAGSVTPTIVYVPAGFLAVANPPLPEVASASQVTYNSWNVYFGSTGTNATKQNTSPLSNTATYTEPTTGATTTGVSVPTANNLTPLYGYIIEFRYRKIRQAIQTLASVLQVPDIYKDIVIAGVNYYTNLWLHLKDDPEMMRANVWKAEFLEGLKQLRRDLNVSFRSTDFVAPDATSQYGEYDTFQQALTGTT
jgi:hypothetical protein